MTTVLQIIEDAYDDIEVKSAETALTASEIAKGLRYYNRIVSSFDAAGLHLGVSKADTPDTESFIPDFAEMLIVTHLGIALGPSFGVVPSAALIAFAEKALNDAIAATAEIPLPMVDGNLPLGSGTHGQSDYLFHERFTGTHGQAGHSLREQGGETLTDDTGNAITTPTDENN